VIEHFDVVEQLHLRLAVALEPFAELTLDRRDKRFHDRVVVTITAAAHAADDAARRHDALIVLARVRAALVPVMQQPDLRAATSERDLERPDGHVAIVHGLTAQPTSRADRSPRPGF